MTAIFGRGHSGAVLTMRASMSFMCSAMPFKKNPISSENICSLARFVASLPQVASENASLSYLERTLDDSANKRIVIAEAFLTTDQILMTAEKIITNRQYSDKQDLLTKKVVNKSTYEKIKDLITYNAKYEDK